MIAPKGQANTLMKPIEVVPAPADAKVKAPKKEIAAVQVDESESTKVKL